jgi:hypothetical protein
MDPPPGVKPQPPSKAVGHTQEVAMQQNEHTEIEFDMSWVTVANNTKEV